MINGPNGLRIVGKDCRTVIVLRSTKIVLRRTKLEPEKVAHIYIYIRASFRVRNLFCAEHTLFCADRLRIVETALTEWPKDSRDRLWIVGPALT